MTRRTFLGACAAVGAGAVLDVSAGGAVTMERAYHACLSPDALEADPGLLDTVRDAGVRTVWLTGFMYGHWPYSVERTTALKKRVEQAGMQAQVVNVPLGHPGDSLGAMHGDIPLTPPRHWQLAVRPDGSRYAGTSLHLPATSENREAVLRLLSMGFRHVFLDDDFRLATGPGVIGGCFCETHREQFLRGSGYAPGKWEELLEAVNRRDLTPLLQEWVDFTCDQLTASFRAQQEGSPEVRLGIMVMYLGAEKAGIRLADYRNAPFRVGELMFDDASFAPVKGKTNELFSALFHRRYARPELAYSETTAFPADRLSARHMAAKLVVSTIADVRTTMFMSGLTPFPRTHWQTLAPAMKQQAQVHRRLAGHRPRGPFKHFWGEFSRKVGSDDPYSLFLACGIPFEVTDAPARDGWTFLSDADAKEVVGGRLRSRGTVFVTQSETGLPGGRVLPESLPALFALKRELLPSMKDTPYVEEEVPVVCAWYPSARRVLLWNLSDRRETLTLQYKNARKEAALDGLETALLDL